MKGAGNLKIYVDKNALQDYTTKLIAKEKTIFATKDQVGSPLVASTVAGMTDHDKIYVYVGSETGYTSGNWYYWDGSAWTSGGIYNSEGFVLDDTLTSATLPAQAKAVGDKVNQLSEDKANIRLDNVVNNSVLPTMIEGASSRIHDVDFTNFTETDNTYTYAGTNAFATNTLNGVLTTGAIPFSAFDGISEIKVTFPSITQPVMGLQRQSGACTGWSVSSLPSSFVTNHTTYYSVNLNYLRQSTGTMSVVNMFFNFDMNGYTFTYQASETLTAKSINWLKLNYNNSHVPFIVDANGNGDFTSIQSAIDAASDFDEILIMPGTYNESVVVTDKYIYLHGLDANTTFLVNNTGNYNTPPLWMCTGVVEGLTIYHQKTGTVTVDRYGYAIHLDQKWGTRELLRSFTLKDCIVKSDFAGPIGCGVRDGAFINIDNCVIISTGETNPATSCFQIHGDTSASGDCYISVTDSVFKMPLTSNARGILFSNGGTNTGTRFNCRFSNNRIKRFYNNCGDLFILDTDSYGNDISALNGEPGAVR